MSTRSGTDVAVGGASVVHGNANVLTAKVKTCAVHFLHSLSNSGCKTEFLQLVSLVGPSMWFSLFNLKTMQWVSKCSHKRKVFDFVVILFQFPFEKLHSGVGCKFWGINKAMHNVCFWCVGLVEKSMKIIGIRVDVWTKQYKVGKWFNRTKKQCAVCEQLYCSNEGTNTKAGDWTVKLSSNRDLIECNFLLQLFSLFGAE